MLTRRDFLKYTVISGATILGASFLGCMKKEVVSEKS
ncbi:MAG TPA: twin-arginine translocation signal domain-containing protein, partial [Archaeoglobus profundus]|nr:twin-arginine translocation signal domain-containing protein [Archaeoglobus profundus]